MSIRMARKVGYGKNGSKWKPCLQLMLRAIALLSFQNLYAPDLLAGNEHRGGGRGYCTAKTIAGPHVLPAVTRWLVDHGRRAGARTRADPQTTPAQSQSRSRDIPPAPPADDGLEDAF